MAKKVILSNEALDMISDALDSLPEPDGYAWYFDIDFNFDDEQKPVSITLKLLKINV